MKSLYRAQKIVRRGEPLRTANAAMILVHGRGARAEDILMLVDEFDENKFSYLAPQAANSTWYPNSFLAPIESNEPGISSGLAVVEDIVAEIEDAGLPSERIVLLGFSQGACLTLEFAARNARRWGGVVGLSGGLIGPEGTPRNYTGSFQQTPVFLGCSDVDPHIPKERVIETAQVLMALGGDVVMKLYPSMPHTVNHDEIRAVNTLMKSVVDSVPRRMA